MQCRYFIHVSNTGRFESASCVDLFATIPGPFSRAPFRVAKQIRSARSTSALLPIAGASFVHPTKHSRLLMHSRYLNSFFVSGWIPARAVTIWVRQ